MNTIVITGASGFIGKHLIAKLLLFKDLRIKVLSRNQDQGLHDLIKLGVEIVKGDLLDPDSLKDLLEQDCTIINLVYLWHGGEIENITAITNLLNACKSANVKRLVHCSTAAVVGRVSDNTITETTPCYPVTEYGITKLKIEKAILTVAKDHFDAVILRPTAVFGKNGAPLRKLADDLSQKSRFHNYLKSCLFNKRRMNLVHVANVIASIIFLTNRTEKIGGEIFIVSDDDCAVNNFFDVERALLKAFDMPYYGLLRLQVPPVFLKFLLICLGRNNVNPHCNYSPDKLLQLGFERSISFEVGLAEYASWYRSSYLDGHESAVN